MIVHGLLLAAGAGRRMGRPKALVLDPDGSSWLLRSIDVLRTGGCQEVTVVLGAAAQDAAALVPEGVTVVVANDWAEGMGASLRAGLAALPAAADAVVVSLVDLPDVDADVVRRVVAAATGPSSLARAGYDGVPGHPVLMGRAHWVAVAAVASGEVGARSYLARHEVELVECGDLATGRDVDRPSAPPVLDTRRAHPSIRRHPEP